MKNLSSIFDFIYLVMLMAAGTVGVVMLLDANTFYRYERFIDKSLIELTSTMPGAEADPNLFLLSDNLPLGMTCPEITDNAYTTDEIIAMFYVQDETCPDNIYGDISLSIGGHSYAITDSWEAMKASYNVDVVNTTYPYRNVADAEFLLIWNPVSHNWVFCGRHYMPKGRNGFGKLIYYETGVPLGEI